MRILWTSPALLVLAMSFVGCAYTQPTTPIDMGGVKVTLGRPMMPAAHLEISEVTVLVPDVELEFSIQNYSDSDATLHIGTDWESSPDWPVQILAGMTQKFRMKYIPQGTLFKRRLTAVGGSAIFEFNATDPDPDTLSDPPELLYGTTFYDLGILITNKGYQDLIACDCSPD